jgi:hypothetical protein
MTRQKTPKRKVPLVLVVWQDAHAVMTPRPHGKYRMYTVGWLLKKGKQWTVLADETTDQAQWRGFTRIPTSNVSDIVRLAEKRKPRKGDA